MQIIERNAPNAGYETGDAIATVTDSHQWSPAELNLANFIVKTAVTLTDNEVSLLMMDDVQRNDVALAQLHTFRDKSTGHEGVKTLHRRKYKHDGSAVVIKQNAQVIE